MMRYNELALAQTSALVPHADLLRLAAAAYLARFKGVRESLRLRAAHAGPIADDTLLYRVEFHQLR